jgi:ribose transport system substrate-binding protein
MARLRTFAGLGAALILLASACTREGPRGTGEEAQPFFDQPIDLDLSEPELGPNGEPATPVSEVEALTEDEKQQIRQGSYTAALLWAGAGEWYNALSAGAQDVFEELGVEVVATTDAEFDPAKQANQVESAMALDPDIVLTLIVDPVSGAEGFRPVVEADKLLVLADNGAEGYQAGREYVAVVTGDHFGMGQAAAELMSDALGGEGEVGMIFHDADFFVTNNRDNSFRATIEQRMPDITIVDAKGFTEEPATFDAASAMISQHPEIDAIYVAWDVAAEGVVEAIRAAGRSDDILVVTHDLGVNNAIAMASEEIVYGTVADLPYDIGGMMATLAGYGLLGKETPPFIVGQFIKVTKDDLANAWQRSLNKSLPPDVAAELG